MIFIYYVEKTFSKTFLCNKDIRKIIIKCTSKEFNNQPQ